MSTENKIAVKHDVLREEVDEVFENEEAPPFIVRSDKVPAYYVALGRSLSGRYLMVAFKPEGKGIINVRTAREMDQKERRRYQRR